jgi:PKD repeat protein
MKFALVALAVLVSACSSPLAPNNPALVPELAETAPFTLSLNGTAGTGASGGTASIVARVQNSHGTNLAGVMVSFKTDVGSLSSASAETIADGTASLMLTAATPATITASAGTLTAHTSIHSNPNVPTVPPVPDGPAPAPPGPPAPGPLEVRLLVTPGATGTATTFGLASSGISRAVWTFGDGASTTTTVPSASHVYAAAGSYTASVTITDTIGRSASNSQLVVITDAPPPPGPPPPPAPSYTVTVSASPSSLVVNESATLTAAVTANNGAAPATSYAWDCDANGTVDATTSSNTTTCSYPTAGPAMKSSVTVTGGTATGSGSVTVTVNAAAPLAVSVSALPTGAIGIGQLVTFTATLTSTGGVPMSGITWEWDDNGDGVYEFASPAHMNPNSRTTSYGSAAVFTLKVRATDQATGRTAIGTRTVTVQ